MLRPPERWYTNSTQFTGKGQLLPTVMNILGSKWWSQQAYSDKRTYSWPTSPPL